MRSIYFFIFSLILILLLFPEISKSNSLTVPYPSKVDQITEKDSVEGDSLFTDMIIQLVIPNDTFANQNITILLNPRYMIQNLFNLNNIIICKNYTITGYNYRYNSTHIGCNSEINNFTKTFNENDQSLSISIPTHEIVGSNNLLIRIQYTIPNFVLKEGHVKFLSEWVGNKFLYFFSQCIPEVSCNIKNWERTVVLPESAILDNFIGNAKLTAYDDKNLIFEMQGDGNNFITYHDSREKELVLPLFFTSLGVLGGLLGTFLYDYIKSQINKRLESKDITNMVGNSIWKIVLHTLYENATNASFYSSGIGTGFWNNEHPLAKELKISGQQLGQSMTFLSNQKLIDGYLGSEQSSIDLTLEGFRTALKNETSEREDKQSQNENKLHTTIAIFTTIVGLTSIWQVLRITEIISSQRFIDYGFIFVMMIILVYWTALNYKNFKKGL
ncbi:MAG: hypothetical protein HYW23_02915 [Candidatus Aenigmarchaeota archaeon]|nr:hypothetical protein [Candidatus Aenigmarchaeota archaeon]